MKHIFLLSAFIFLPAATFAQSGTAGRLTWTLDGGTLTVSGTGAMPDYTYNEHPSWYEHRDNITTVIIEEGVTTFESSAFQDCPSLESVTIPASVTGIGHNAFGFCTSLTSINVADGNTDYESADGVLFNEAQTVLIQYPAGKAGTSYEIPAGVNTIEEWAFNGSRNLASVTIPAGVTTVGYRAFVNCSSLTDVTVEWTTAPPSIESSFDRAAAATLHVPAGTKTLYETADGWKDFGTIEEMPRGGDDGTETLPSGVYANCYQGVLTVDTPVAEQIAVYSMNGALLYQAQKETGEAVYRPGHLPKGILIVKGSSGWVKKFAAK